MSYAERAARFLAHRRGGVATTEPEREESERSEERAGPAGVWWDDRMPAGSAPILCLPPAGCIAPRACARLGPCERHAAGRPCLAGTPRGAAGDA